MDQNLCNQSNFKDDNEQNSCNSQAKKEEITCIHHISYKAYGPNNFVKNHVKRYYNESTGETVYEDTPQNSINYDFTHDPYYLHHSYSRDYYHPYFNQINNINKSFSHNRMNSEPPRQFTQNFNNFYCQNKFLQDGPPIKNFKCSNSHTDYINYPDKKLNFNNIMHNCNKFEGSEIIENSPLHKYNLLDPPIFKRNNIKIPSRIPFLIRLDSLDEDRVNMIKTASIIFGRSDNRRKSSSLNLNEMLMNEVAFQLCLRDPLYLVSRQKLIMESREIIRESGHRIQDDINISPFQQAIDINNQTKQISSCSSSNKSLKTIQDAQSINEVRDAPIIPVSNSNEVDPFLIQEETSSVRCRNLMAKYCYDDYDTIHFYKTNGKWPPNVEPSRKAYLRRKSKKFKVIDNHLYSTSTSSERLRLWLKDINAVIEHAPRFHISIFTFIILIFF